MEAKKGATTTRAGWQQATCRSGQLWRRLSRASGAVVDHAQLVGTASQVDVQRLVNHLGYGLDGGAQVLVWVGVRVSGGVYSYSLCRTFSMAMRSCRFSAVMRLMARPR